VAENGNLDDRAADGVAHLQAAARELIAAARAMLDVAEDLVADPGAVSAVVDAFGSVVRTAARAARDVTGSDRDRDDEGPHGVERIQVG
jgi:hypothetical protein